MKRIAKNYLRLFALICLSALQVTSAWAAPATGYYRVDNGGGSSIDGDDDDNSGADGACTLRDAFSAVNDSAGIGIHTNGCTITAVGSPSSFVYVISLPTGVYTYTLDTGRGELLTSANKVYIVGDTASNTIIQANVSYNTATYRVLRNNGAIVNLDSVTIRNGVCEGACAGDFFYGGGIYNQAGEIIMTNCMVSNNRAATGGGIYNKKTVALTKSKIVNNEYTSAGGGIYNEGGLSVTDSTLSANASAEIGAHHGGGIFNNFNGTLTISNSLLADNEAHTALGSGGGGLYNSGGTGTIINSTFSGNSSIGAAPFDFGGGIYNSGTLTLAYCTLSGNNATNGGGLYNIGTLHLNSSIIADSVSGVDCLNDGTMASNSKNMIEDNTCSPSKSGDPKLDTLKYNGGLTMTMALLSGSPALDAIPKGTNGCGTTITTDQRGVRRPQDKGCEIGAYEVKGFPWLYLIPALTSSNKMIGEGN